MNSNSILSKQELLTHWQGHRGLTRKVIEKFPEEELFSFSIGGMRTFADLTKELLSIAVPGLDGIVHRKVEPFSHDLDLNTKQELLDQWDQDTPKINDLYNQIPEADFHKSFNLFGQFNFPIIHNILYFIDNEIHHRGQGYTYLRALGIEPPAFWDR